MQSNKKLLERTIELSNTLSKHYQSHNRDLDFRDMVQALGPMRKVI